MNKCIDLAKNGNPCRGNQEWYERCKKHCKIHMELNNLPVPEIKSTITITIGDRAENHHGMEMIGKSAKEGISVGKI